MNETYLPPFPSKCAILASNDASPAQIMLDKAGVQIGPFQERKVAAKHTDDMEPINKELDRSLKVGFDSFETQRRKYEVGGAPAGSLSIDGSFLPVRVGVVSCIDALHGHRL